MFHVPIPRYLLIMALAFIPALGVLLKTKARAENSISVSPHEQPAIIFDLGGVLMDVQRAAVLSQLGWLSTTAYYATTFGKNPKKGLYNLLTAIQPKPSDIPVKDDQGYLVPSLMVDWFANVKTGKEIEELVNTYLQQHQNDFSCIERTILRRLTHALFDPVAFSQSCIVTKEAIQLVKKCKKRGFRVGILSNLDAQSFALVKHNNPELFNLFAEEDIFVSGNLGLVKPDPKIYAYVLDKIEGPVILVDDQLENIIAARKAGFKAIHFKQASGLSGLFGNKKEQTDIALKKIVLLQKHYFPTMAALMIA